MKNIFIRLYLLLKGLARISVWFFTRPQTTGSVAFIEYRGSVLLIQKNLSKKNWALPGGNQEEKETPEETAVRETKEETNIDVEIITKLGEYKEREYFRNHTTHVFQAKALHDKIRVDPVEIKAAQFFSLYNLPKNLGRSFVKAQEMR